MPPKSPSVTCKVCRKLFLRHLPTPVGGVPVRGHINNDEIAICTSCFRGTIPGDFPGGPGDKCLDRIPIAPSKLRWQSSPFSPLAAQRPSPARAARAVPLTHQPSARLKADTIEVEINYTIYDPNDPRTIDPRLSTAKKITIGDLHGNTMTLFIILLKCGALVPRDRTTAAVAFNIISSLVFKASISLDDPLKVPLDAKDYRNFITRINEFDVNPNAPALRLLGDVLADRLSNDVLTLALLHKLILDSQGRYSITIIYSNHDNEFFIYLASFGIRPTPHYLDINFMESHTKWLNFFAFVAIPDAEIARNVYASIRAYIRCFKMFDYEYPILHTHAGRPAP